MSRPPQYAAMDWYDTPQYYDIVFDTDTAKEADFLEALARRYGSPGQRTVLEPACGSGRLVAEMARRGWQAAGFDRNSAMLRYARARLRAERLRARLWQDDMCAFRAPRRYALAHCLVTTFKYILSEAGARAHLQRVARALQPGGLYVLGFHLTEYGRRSLSRERWDVRRGGTRVISNLQIWPADRRRRRERVRCRLQVHENGVRRHGETSWQFRTYDAVQVRRLLCHVPEFEHVATYDFDYRADRPQFFPGRRLDVILVLRRTP